MNIENYAGKFHLDFPLQTVVIPISEDFEEYALKVSKEIKKAA